MWKALHVPNCRTCCVGCRTDRISNSQYYNCRRLRDACLYLCGTEDDAVDQYAVRRLWDPRGSSSGDVCSQFCFDTLHAYVCVPGTVRALGDLCFSLPDNSLLSWNHHNYHYNIQWHFSNCRCRSFAGQQSLALVENTVRLSVDTCLSSTVRLVSLGFLQSLLALQYLLLQ